MQQSQNTGRTPVDLRISLGGYEARIDAGPGMFEETESVSSYTHSHVAYDIHYLLRGEYRVDIAGGTLLLRAGQLLVIAPGVYHAVGRSPDSPEPPLRVSFNLSFHRGADQPRGSSGAEGTAVLKAFQSLSSHAVIPDDFAAASLFSGIQREFQQQRTGYYLKMRSAMSDLLVELARRLETGPTRVRPPEKTPEDRQLEILDDFFDPNLLKKSSKSELAGRLQVSVRQVDRIMRQRFGMSFREKLLECRMELAKHLLSSGDLTVQAISELTGYGFESSLHKAFKSHTGLTPTEYRTKSRKPR